MKLEIDTINKTIKLEEDVNLNEFVKMMDSLLPKKWKEFTLITNTIINWTNPIVVKPYEPYRHPWWEQPIITYDTNGTDNYNLSPGVYSVQY